MSDLRGPFGRLLRHHRVRANLTHEALAARSGLSVDAISMLERGTRQSPRQSTVLALAQALRLPTAAREVFLAAAESPTVPSPPAPRPAPPTYPPTVADDWTEAHAALAAGLPKAAAAIALRAVQGVCVEKKAARGRRLYDQIEELGRAQVFHPALVDWALQIRLLETMVSRPDEDGLDAVTQEDAVGVIAFLDELLRFTYELPDRLAKLRAETSPRPGKELKQPGTA